MRRALASVLMASVAWPALAQPVPAIARADAAASAQVSVPSDGAPPPNQRRGTRANLPVDIDFPATSEVGPKPPPLSAKERRALKLASKSAERPAMPRADAEGYVRFTYGATQPTVVCAPSRLCLIALQPGEIITGTRDGKDIGHFRVSDTVNWTVEPMVSGAGKGLVTTLSVRPSQPDLVATLVVPTQRRLYSITLRSASKEWMPLVGFDYPGSESDAAAAAYRKQVSGELQSDTGETSIAALDFGFKVSGDDVSWVPTSVYTDGRRTILQLPDGVESTGLPVLVGIGDDGTWFSSPSRTVITSRMLPGNKMLVDGVPDKAALVSGVGDEQHEVMITRVKSTRVERASR